MRVLLAGAFLAAGFVMDAGATSRNEPLSMIGVDEAAQRLNAYLLEHDDNAAAHFSLGRLHGVVYALGCDAIPVTLSEIDEFPLHLDGHGLPPHRMAKRLQPLPPDRALHLAKAVAALHRATSLDTENPTYWNALGYLYHECRDRFGEGDWPLESTPFDAEAKELGGRPAYWEELALSALRRLAPEGMPEAEAVEEFRYASRSPEQLASLYAASIIVEILSRRESLTPEETDELERMKVVMTMTEPYLSRKPMGERELPPPPVELAAIYPVTPSGLATAELYFRALDASMVYIEDQNDLPIVGGRAEMQDSEPMSAEMLTRVGEYLGHHRETFRLLAQAAQSPECRYPVDLTQGVYVELEHLPPLRGLARLLALRALHAAEIGSVDIAGQAVIECIALGESLRKEPLIISQMVRVAIHAIAVDMLQEVMNRVTLNTASMERIKRALIAADKGDALQIALRGDAYGMIQAARNPPPPPDFSNLSPELRAEMQDYQPPTILAADVQAMYDRFAAAAALPYGLALAEFTENAEAGPFILPSLPRAYTAFVRHAATLRNAQGALAVERYWAAHGHAPESLHDLVPLYTPALLIDPFDGEPLRFRAEEGGYVVYSVADNLTDDNGEKGDARPTLDIVFKVGIETGTEGEAEGDEL